MVRAPDRAEAEFAHRIIASAYDFGGDLDEDRRLLQYVRYVLELAGSDWEPALADLVWLRESVKRGERLPGLDHVLKSFANHE
jgi:hypothetical protein